MNYERVFSWEQGPHPTVVFLLCYCTVWVAPWKLPSAGRLASFHPALPTAEKASLPILGFSCFSHKAMLVITAFLSNWIIIRLLSLFLISQLIQNWPRENGALYWNLLDSSKLSSILNFLWTWTLLSITSPLRTDGTNAGTWVSEPYNAFVLRFLPWEFLLAFSSSARTFHTLAL